MKNRTALIAIQTLAAAFLLSILPSAHAGPPAKEIILKDGTTVRGTVMMETDQAVMLQTAGGIKKIEKKDIDKMTDAAAQTAVQSPTEPGAPAPAPGTLKPPDPLLELDTIKLKDGTSIKGEVTVQTDTLVMVRMHDGSTKKLARADVVEVIRVTKEDLKKMYEEKKEAADANDYPAFIKLADWCFANKLQEEGKKELEAASKSDSRKDLLDVVLLSLEEEDVPFAGSVAAEGAKKFPDEEIFQRIGKLMKDIDIMVSRRKALEIERDRAAAAIPGIRAELKELRAKARKTHETCYEEKTEVIKCKACGGSGRIALPRKDNQPQAWISCPKCDGGKNKKTVTKKVKKTRKLDTSAAQKRIGELEPLLASHEKKVKTNSARINTVNATIQGIRRKILAEAEK